MLKAARLVGIRDVSVNRTAVSVTNYPHRSSRIMAIFIDCCEGENWQSLFGPYFVNV